MSLRTRSQAIILVPQVAEKQLAVPQVNQRPTEWCWAACAQMFFLYYGLMAKDQCDIASFLLGRQCCPDLPECNKPCKIADIQTIFHNWHLGSARTDSSVAYELLKNEINAERPVEVVFTWKGGGQHAAVVCGWQDLPFGSSVFVNDPADGPGPVDYSYLLKAYGNGRWTHTWTKIEKQTRGK